MACQRAGSPEYNSGFHVPRPATMMSLAANFEAQYALLAQNALNA